MSRSELAGLIISATGVLLIPAIVLLVRLTIKWTKVELSLEDLVGDVKKLVEDKDRAHMELYNIMKEDRNNADRRLRWLEENIWKKRGP